MNIVKRLTLHHLKENKVRTVITTLGICISVAMITAVFVAVASIMNLFAEIELLSGGSQHAVFSYVSSTQTEQLKKDDRIKRVGLRIIPEYASYRIENGKNERTGTGDIYMGDYTNLEQMFLGTYVGTLPKNENEIVVEQDFIERNNLDWEIGNIVEIPLGERYIVDNGEKLTIGGSSYFGGEKFRAGDIIEVKITAISYENPATVNSYSIVRGYDSSKPLSDGINVQAYIELKELNYKSIDVIHDIIREYDIQDYDINSHYLETKFAIDENSTLATTILPMAVVVLIIIMIASVILIYNAFGMSLSERVRYLGMLASVGATRRQKKASVYYEGLILGAVGIPVGIIAGIIGIGITLKAVGKEIISSGMIRGVSDSGMNMDVIVPVWAIIGIVVFSAITIFISSFIPSRKASKITPIDAIQRREEIKVKAKKLKSPKIVRAIFGYEGELAHKNLKRNGRKSRVIIASIALSVILFMSVNYFCSLLSVSIELEADVPYQIQATVNYEDKASFLKKVDGISGIDKYYSVTNSTVLLSERGAQRGEDQTIKNSKYLKPSYKNFFDSTKYLYVNMIDDEDFNKLCENNDIDYKQYYEGNIKALIMDNTQHRKGEDGVFNDSVLGLKINAGTNEVTINDFVSYDSDFYVCNLNTANSSISLYTPVSAVIGSSKDNTDKFSYMLGIETKQHEEVTQKIQEIFDESKYESTFVMDYVESLQMMNTLVFVIQVFVYGFIVLITLITIANIINTISTGIAMRRKEFAMFKSVGITPKGFRKMIALESAFYGIKAIIVSVPISILISFGMYHLIADGAAIPFSIDWLLYLIVIAVVFAVIGLTMVYSVSKLKNDSIVETLKEEIN